VNINERKPEDVLKPEFVQAYKALHQDIWLRLVHVHTNIIVLDKIQQFPFEHIYAPQDNVFWSMAYSNFYGVSVILLHTLMNDQADQSHTLNKFKNTLLANWLIKSYRDNLKAQLKTAKFDTQIKHIGGNITQLRNKVFAHRFAASDGTLSTKSLPRLPLPELRAYYEAVENLFRACSFGAEYVTTFYLEGTVRGQPVKKDIEQILDLIVKNSPWLNQPERRGQFWPVIRKYRSQEQIEELNRWRRKFGMPDA